MLPVRRQDLRCDELKKVRSASGIMVYIMQMQYIKSK